MSYGAAAADRKNQIRHDASPHLRRQARPDQDQIQPADFAGRHWIAWFSTEIPIQDGPYKFRDLPGLIVKIEDKTGSHKMELKGIKNITGNVDINVFEVKEIAVNSKQFQKVLKEYENDPTKGIKQIQMGGTSIILTGKDGTSTKIAKEQEERLKARIKKDNNRIELDIVK